MPARTFTSKLEKIAPGFKPAKDYLTLLGGNAAGDFNLKLCLVRHSQNPRAMKGFPKASLPVHWHLNEKTWRTLSIFQEWILTYFCPYIKKYCRSKNLDNRALLILDNASSHTLNISGLCLYVRVENTQEHHFLAPSPGSRDNHHFQGLLS